METQELRDLEYIKKVSNQYLNILKPTSAKNCNAEIKVLNYSELGCVITNLLRLCILALEYDHNEKSSLDIGLILEQVLQLFPSDEMELLDIVKELLRKDSE
jgi:hypothetical protein